VTRRAENLLAFVLLSLAVFVPTWLERL